MSFNIFNYLFEKEKKKKVQATISAVSTDISTVFFLLSKGTLPIIENFK